MPDYRWIALGFGGAALVYLAGTLTGKGFLKTVRGVFSVFYPLRIPRAFWVFLLCLATFAVGAAVGLYVAPIAQPSASGEKKASYEKNTIYALGKLQPAGSVVPVMAPPGDRIASFEKIVKVNADVAENCHLFTLASYQDYQKEVDLADTQLLEASAQRNAVRESEQAKLNEIALQEKMLVATRDADLRAQSAKITLLKDAQVVALARLNRIKNLDTNVVQVSAQEMEQVQLAEQQASSELKAAEEARGAAENKYKLQKQVLEASRHSARAEATLAANRIPTESIKQHQSLAQWRRDRARVKAPVAGTIAQVFASVGDPTGTTPVLHIIAGGKMTAVAEVYATDIKQLREWTNGTAALRVTLTSPALEHPLKGALSPRPTIAPVVARNSLMGFTPRADSDRRIVEVRVPIDDSDAAKAAQFVGLEVNVEFTVRPQSDSASR